MYNYTIDTNPDGTYFKTGDNKYIIKVQRPDGLGVEVFYFSFIADSIISAFMDKRLNDEQIQILNQQQQQLDEQIKNILFEQNQG